MLSRTEFLSMVLPPQGVYFSVAIESSIKKIKKWEAVNTQQELEEKADKYVSQQLDAFFALASFKDPEGGRKADNAKELKAFFLDIDCGEDKAAKGDGYVDQDAGLAALQEFCKKVGLSRPIIVLSGRGIHAYWPFEKAMPAAQWKEHAVAFKRLCTRHGLLIDLAVPADAARVLRVPDTMHFKDKDKPLTVEALNKSKLLTEDQINKMFPVDDFMSKLERGDFAKRPLDETTRALAGLDNREYCFKDIFKKSIEGNGCNQIKWLYENQTDLTEPLWRASLSTPWACTDKFKGIKIMAQNHPDYDESANIAKANKTVGSYSCETYAELNPAGCADCQIKDTVKGNPKNLGLQIARSEDEEIVVVDEVHDEQNGIDVAKQYVIPKFPFPYFRGKTGGIYVEVEDGSEEPPMMLYPHDFYAVRRLIDPNDGECILIRLHLPKDGVKEVNVPLSTVISKDRFMTAISKMGVAVTGKKQDALMNYITRWVQELQAREKADVARLQFGWTEDDSGFVIGDREITTHGTVYSPPSTPTLPLIPIFQQKGDFHVWRDVVNYYSTPEQASRAFSVSLGLGNMLTKFLESSDIYGYVAVLVGESGFGKTTLLRTIASAYGDPSTYMMRKADTLNMKMGRMGTFGSIINLLDESTDMLPEEKAAFAFQATEGRAKGRMRSDVNAERVNKTFFHSGTITTTNRSWITDITSAKEFASGELNRIVEFTIDRDTSGKDAAWSRSHFGRLGQNYGHAADIMATYVVNNLPACKAILKDVHAKVDQASGATETERFWTAIAALAVTGATIANKLKIVDYDPASIMRFGVSQIEQMRHRYRQIRTESKDFLGKFIQQHYHEILVINGNTDKRTGLEMGPIREPRGPLTMRYEPDNKRLFILAAPLRKDCSKAAVSLEDLLEDHRKSGAFLGTKKRRMTTGTNIAGDAVNTYIFDTEKLGFSEADLIGNTGEEDTD